MNRRAYLSTAATGLACSLAGCAGDRSDPGGATGSGTSLAIQATAFDDGEPIPARYTCAAGAGDGVNPELTVSGVVDAVESLALVVDDPDAGDTPFVHWLLWNVPASTGTIPRGVAHGPTVASLDGANQGTNSAGTVGYTGPCPPPADDPHTYRFHLYALDATLDLRGGAERPALESAMGGHLVDGVALTGTFER